MSTLRSGYINELLARHGIAGTDTGGTDAEAAAQGGTIATLHVQPYERFGPVLTVTIRERSFSRVCPLECEDARSLVDAFASHHLLPHDAGMKHMLIHLLLNTSSLYLESGADALTLAPVHLHPSAYHIGGVDLVFRNRAPNLRRRLQPHAHDRRTGRMLQPGPRRNAPEPVRGKHD